MTYSDPGCMARKGRCFYKLGFLSEDIISQYEDGMAMEVSVNKTRLSGQTTYTATVKQRPSDAQ